MPTSKPLAAAIAGLLFACAGAAAAEGHVKIFNGYDLTASPATQPGATTVKSVPVTPLDDPRLAKDLSAGKPTPSAAWFTKYDGVDGSSKNDAPAARPLRSAPGGESYLEIKMQDAFVTSYQVGGTAKPPMDGAPRGLSAGERGGVASVDHFVKPPILRGESKDASPIPALQAPQPAVPRSPAMPDVAGSTLMIGEKHSPRAAAPVAPAIRR